MNEGPKKQIKITRRSRRDEFDATEKFQFVGFMSDYDPSILFALTFSSEKKVSYLKMFKVERKFVRSYSGIVDEEKKVFIDKLKENLS